MRDIGTNIRTLRQKQHMNQDQLAEKLFVTRQTVSNYETGRSRPDIEMLTRIAEVLQTDPNTLLYGPAPEEFGKQQWLRFGIWAAVTAAVFLGLDWLEAWTFDMRGDFFIVYPNYLVNVHLYPPACILLGILFAWGCRMAMKAKRVANKWSPWVFWFAAVLLGAYFLLLLPHHILSLRGHLLMLSRNRAGLPYSSADWTVHPFVSFLAENPVSMWCYLHVSTKRLVFAALGALMGFFDRKTR